MSGKMGSGAGHILDGIKRRTINGEIVKDLQADAKNDEPNGIENERQRSIGVSRSEKMSEKVCPLTRLVCLKESCQWWTRSLGGRCSIYVMADSMKHWWQIWKK